MNNLNIKYIFIIIFLFTVNIYCQWEVSPVFNFKSEKPQSGAGLYVSRNLPFQFATFGLKVRGEINYYWNDIDDNSNKYSSIDLNASIITTFYPGIYQPYLGFGLGIDRFLADPVSNGDLLTKYIFKINIISGTRFSISSLIYPFIELQLSNYFYDFEENTGADISGFQLKGSVGVSIEINPLENP